MINEIQHTVFTIGHSTHSFDDFLKMLQSFHIEMVADIRSYPGSRKFPQFNKENLANTLPENNIEYIHIPKLGGRRRVKKDSKNNRWRKDAFKGYADYMETNDFKMGIEELEKLAVTKKTAYMCSEAVWWRCHRSMVSDFLKAKGWKVLHIMAIGKSEEHPYTAPARIINGGISYSDED